MALGELKCPSLDYVYNMTWAEYRIRLFAHKRKEKKEWLKIREIAYQVYVSNWYSKKRPLSKERYMPIENKKQVVPDHVREAIKNAQEEYFRQLNDG